MMENLSRKEVGEDADYGNLSRSLEPVQVRKKMADMTLRDVVKNNLVSTSQERSNRDLSEDNVYSEAEHDEYLSGSKLSNLSHL